MVDHELDGTSSLSTSENVSSWSVWSKKSRPRTIEERWKLVVVESQTETLKCRFQKQGVEAFWALKRFRPIEVALDFKSIGIK